MDDDDRPLADRLARPEPAASSNRSHLATGSGLLGLLTLLSIPTCYGPLLVAPFAALLGYLALREISRDGKRGAVFAWFGFVIGLFVFSIAATIITIAFFG